MKLTSRRDDLQRPLTTSYKLMKDCKTFQLP